MRAAHPTHLITPNTVKLIVSFKEDKLRNSSLCNACEVPVTSRPWTSCCAICVLLWEREAGFVAFSCRNAKIILLLTEFQCVCVCVCVCVYIRSTYNFIREKQDVVSIGRDDCWTLIMEAKLKRLGLNREEENDNRIHDLMRGRATVALQWWRLEVRRIAEQRWELEKKCALCQGKGGLEHYWTVLNWKSGDRNYYVRFAW
jgi:hypothetical protein